MDIRKITDKLSVSPQIGSDDVAAIANAGFKTIICNRPDHEGGPEQPRFDDMAREAEKHAIVIVYQPVVSGAMTMEDIQSFGSNLESAQAPILAYCRTGTRCTALWAMTEKLKGTPPEEIISAAATAGYDMSALVGN